MITDNEKIRQDLQRLMSLYQAGQLGGEKMPEDENPGLPVSSNDNYLYFTLPMALNYQRNSYKLWESARQTFCDCTATSCFSPRRVVQMTDGELAQCLLKYKLALQPNKQPVIWRTLCVTIDGLFGGVLRLLIPHTAVAVEQRKV